MENINHKSDDFCVTNVIPNLTEYFKQIPPHIYNGQEDEEMAIAISLSLSELNPQITVLNFMDLLSKKEFLEAYKLYSSTNNDTKLLIDSELDIIPWRIACEYYYTKDKIRWINSWIKIGWWSSLTHEMSPQLSNGKWFSRSDDIHGIDASQFKCVVWKGIGKDMILKLISGNIHEGRVNIELEQQSYFLIPINVAFTSSNNNNNFFDLGLIDVGSLKILPDHKIDIFRILEDTTTLSNGTQILKFQGSTLGEIFIDNKEIDIYESLHSDYDDDESVDETV